MSTAPVAVVLEEIERKKRRRRLIVSVITISVAIHAVAGIIAGIVIVARYLTPPPAEFVTFNDQVPGTPKAGLAAIDVLEIVGAPALQHVCSPPPGSMKITAVVAPDTTKLLPVMVAVCATPLASRPGVIPVTWGLTAAETVKGNQPESPPVELVTFTDQVP